MAHSERTSSAAHRWIKCPGSVAACRGLEDEPSSVYAAEGTAAHELGDICLSLGADPRNYKGKVGDFTCDEEMQEAVGLYVNMVRTYEELKPSSSWFEKKITLPYDSDHEGTLDAFIKYDDGDLTIIDLKFGRGVIVEPKMNPQLMLYALGAGFPPDATITLVIVQPRIPHNDGPVRTWQVSAEALDFWYESVVVPALGADYLFAGEHCLFCRAKATCPAQKALAEQTAMTEFSNYGPPPVPTLTEEEIAKVLFHGKALIEWVNAVKEQAHTTLEKGGTIPGYKLVEKLGNRKWAENVDFEQLENEVEREIYSEPKVLTPAQFEKMTGCKEYLKKHPELIVRVKGTAVVHESDKRPALKGSTAKDDFAGVFEL